MLLLVYGGMGIMKFSLLSLLSGLCVVSKHGLYVTGVEFICMFGVTGDLEPCVQSMLITILYVSEKNAHLFHTHSPKAEGIINTIQLVPEASHVLLLMETLNMLWTKETLFFSSLVM